MLLVASAFATSTLVGRATVDSANLTVWNESDVGWSKLVAVVDQDFWCDVGAVPAHHHVAVALTGCEGTLPAPVRRAELTALQGTVSVAVETVVATRRIEVEATLVAFDRVRLRNTTGGDLTACTATINAVYAYTLGDLAQDDTDTISLVRFRSRDGKVVDSLVTPRTVRVACDGAQGTTVLEE